MGGDYTALIRHTGAVIIVMHAGGYRPGIVCGCTQFPLVVKGGTTNEKYDHIGSTVRTQILWL